MPGGMARAVVHSKIQAGGAVAECTWERDWNLTVSSDAASITVGEFTTNDAVILSIDGRR